MALRALDTNGYVELLRGSPRAAAIRAALGGAGTDLVVLMPVMAELQQGARTTAEARALAVRFLDPVPAGRRVAADAAEWVATGARIAAMARAGHDREELTQRAFFLDVHIAQVCRARGIVLWTDDADHARLRAHVGHRVEPLPR
ncbi:MAG TPA: PIN domain-containing protein [Gemmatirosa sp.]